MKGAAPDPPDPTDQELVRRFQAGDREAFVVLMTRHEAKVYNLAWRKWFPLRSLHPSCNPEGAPLVPGTPSRSGSSRVVIDRRRSAERIEQKPRPQTRVAS